jgi:OPA family sugar phosphate sensor protein UhpC-like MFS transporter
MDLESRSAAVADDAAADDAADDIDATYRRLRWQIFAVTWLAYAGFYLTRKSFPVAKIGIEDDASMHMSKLAMSWADTAYLIAYAIGQFTFGIAGDRVGTRRVVLAGMVTSVPAALVTGASTFTVLFGLMWCIQGLAQSTGWAPLTKNMSTFFSRRERGLVMGFWYTNYAGGGFALLGAMVLLAAVIVSPRWNVLPPTAAATKT